MTVGDGAVARYLHPVLSATSDCQTSSATRTAVVGELCVDQDDGQLWVCKDPSIAATGGLSATLCDGVGDWESAWPSATEIPFTPTGTISSTTVQAAIAEVASEAAGTQVAAGIPFTPAGTVGASNVQAAIEEVASEASVSATRTDPTDCPTNVTTASLGQICTDLDDNQLWICTNPAAGGSPTVCDVPGDWGAKANPASSWQAVMDAGSIFGGAISQATAMKVGNESLGIYEETWADSGGLHKQVSPADNYSTVISTGKNFSFYRNDGTTALWTLTEAGALTTGAAVALDNSAAASTKPFHSGAGAAPTTADTCSYDSTANRYKCGNGTVSNTLAWLSEAGGGVTTDDSVMLGNGTTSDVKAFPNCADSAGNHLNYTAATNSFSCGTSSSASGSGTVTDDSLNVGNGTISEVKAIPNCTDATGSHLNYTAATNTFSCGTTSSNAAVTTDDSLPLGNGTTVDAKVLPNCTDSTGNHLNYTTATNSFSCGTSSSVAAATTVDDSLNLGNGTISEVKAIPNCADTVGSHLNYTAATNSFSCGTSTSGAASITTDDSLPLGNGTTVDAKALPNCTDSTGSHLNYTAATNTFSCGTSSSNAAVTTDDSIPVGNGTVAQAKAVPDCTDATGNHLNYTASTNAFSCGTTTSNAAVTTDDSLQLGNGTVAQAKTVPDCTDATGNHLNYTASSNTFSCGTTTSNAAVTTDDNIPVGNGTIVQAKAVPDCTDTAGNHLNYTASTNAFSCGTAMPTTNIVVDTAGTGNTLNVPSFISFEAAGCNNVTAGPNMDLPTSGAPTPTCFGTTTTQGTLTYADAATSTATRHWRLPADVDLTKSVDVALEWFANSATSNAVRWSVAIGCVADSEAINTGPSYNTASASNTAYTGTANQRKTTTLTGLSTTNCAANENAYLQVQRIGADAGDTLAASAELLTVNLSLWRAM